MSAAAMLGTLRRQAGQRRFARVVAFALPWLLVTALLASRLDGGLAWLLPLAGFLLATLLAWRSLAALDAQWLWRQLDRQRRDLEDSADLLFADAGTLAPLARLQRARLEHRLLAAPAPDVRPPWPWRALFWNAALAVAASMLVVFLPGPRFSTLDTAPPAARLPPDRHAPTRISVRQLFIRPPTYTQLAPRTQESLQANVPEGSTLRWTLRFEPLPTAATLVFHDGTQVVLERQGEDWIGSRRIDKAALYKVVLAGVPALADQRRQRIDVVADQAPQIRVIEPERSLSLLEDGQKQWPLAFEASDDFGLGSAQLRLTLAQGSGENISVSERTLALPGQGDGRRRHYGHALDLGALGFAAGDDLIVRLTVSDNRSPQAQTTRSASFILRWPPEVGAQASGLDGMMKKILPVFFRSQRQIIIDSEALLKQRRTLGKDDYLARSDLIGVDQRILRLRYGQFLGEEIDDGPTSPVPAGTGSADGHDGHDEADPSSPSVRGDAAAVIEAFGDNHDQAEAATLLDPQTRALLKSAVDQMWQAELHLRQGQPQLALPFEYRALGFIKQVQQASRIYLARVGLELPPVDEGRRLSGDRKGLQSRADLLTMVETTDSPVVTLWRSLEGTTTGAADLDAFETWLRAREASLPDPLDLYAAIDSLRADPGCDACTQQLRARLWPLLPVPASAAAARRDALPSGREYLDALQPERQP